MKKRVKKWLPSINKESGGLRQRQVRDGDDLITIHTWSNPPVVELWAWSLGPAGPTRIDLRGLEQYPTQEQLEPALALFEHWKEQHRIDQGKKAGPGPKTKYDEYYNPWEASGFDRKVLREQKERYLAENIDDANAAERFSRAMSRYKQNRS